MPYISQASIQEVQNRLDAIAVVSDYVHLDQKGGRWWACCPFHQEKTGSFTVNPDLKTYYCFGCHKGGSVINFVQEMDKLTFPEAIEQLAKRFSVELVYEDTGGKNVSPGDEIKKKVKEELFELYRRMSGTFHHFFLKKQEADEAKRYIMSRGINNDMINSFRLGYAPGDRYWLHKFLSQKGYSREFLASSGLFSSKYPEISLFSGRLMFPIADRQGRTVAFGGRSLPNAEAQNKAQSGREIPKYINSPELEIYKKGETLFAIDRALPEIRRTKTAYVAEGYMDVIALHQAGITNALAPLGTAFTADQAKLLKRWAEKLVFFFDSDEAGQTAALKAVYTCRSNGIACALVTPGISGLENFIPSPKSPEANEVAGTLANQNSGTPKDPADILLLFGPEALQKKAECTVNDFDYLLARARSFLHNSRSGETPDQGALVQGKARAIAFLFPFFDLLDSEIARNSCIESAADAIGLLPDTVAEDYRHYASAQKPGARNTPAGTAEAANSPIHMNDELSLLTVVAVNYLASRTENVFGKFRTALALDRIDDPNARQLYIALEECYRREENGMDELLARISSPGLRNFLVARSATGEFSANTGQLIKDGLKKIEVKDLEKQNEEIIIKLRMLKNKMSQSPSSKSSGRDDSRDEGQSMDIHELLAEKMRIDNELHTLKQGR